MDQIPIQILQDNISWNWLSFQKLTMSLFNFSQIDYILTPIVQDDISWNWQCLQKLQISLSIVYFLIELTPFWPRIIFLGIGILPETLHLANLFFTELNISWSRFAKTIFLGNWQSLQKPHISLRILFFKLIMSFAKQSKTMFPGFDNRLRIHESRHCIVYQSEYFASRMFQRIIFSSRSG